MHARFTHTHDSKSLLRGQATFENVFYRICLNRALTGNMYPVRNGMYDWQDLQSLDRCLLNETLFAITERLPNKRLFLNHKLSHCSLHTGELHLLKCVHY